MEKPALEIRVEAIGGAGINRTALQMSNLARATSCVVICEFQPGVILQAKPGDAAVDVARQLPGYDGDREEQVYATRTLNNEPEARRARKMERFETHVGYIANEISEIRELFRDFGGR